MDIDKFKSAYRNAGNTPKSKEAIKRMTQAGQHPSLKRIKQQLIIESICWALFLVVYYDFFDGHLKSAFWNGVLIGSVLLLLVHSILGYRITRWPIQGESIKQSLANYVRKVKKYALVSITTRVVAIASLLLFFMSAITFDPGKYWVVGALGLLILVQVYMLSRIWLSRIQKIQKSLEELS